MSASADIAAARPSRAPVSQPELIALVAMLMATVAFSIDAMLPALPAIARDVAGGDQARTALVIAAFMLGMGAGTLFSGPLSDAFGRHRIATWGAVLYIAAALAGAMADSLETLIAARLVQGIGAAGPRIVALAIIRDLYSGRQMARIVSFTMTVFALVPVLAPSLGAGLEWAFGWRGIFFAFAIFSALSILWLRLRLPETLPAESRRPFRLAMLKAGLTEIVAHAQVRRATATQALIYTVLFACLLSSQPVFDITFDRAATFPLWFGLVAAVSAGGSFLNARIVVRLGMLRVIRGALSVMAVYAALYLALLLTTGTAHALGFPLYLLLLIAGFSLAGLCIGNLNALAMQPLGHIAGLAASTISAVATSAGAVMAIPVTLLFDGTPRAAAIGILVATVAALTLTRRLTEPAEPL
ncbi:MFS transporter [Alphaproteobacteria bacterium GH1-50]|uniref:MFS transporter n=1 Tax=Kangsaoukella pontilimi TaxID=2691042 RepID=A0A7C9MCN7_9RHOB|nr:MFS transporter [Kangsaoukella pontilimi]MXQ07232.1 MFS transporter [Kangsaoukella pontilimi]